MGIKKYIQVIFLTICFLLVSFAKPSAITANAIIENENDLQSIYSFIDKLFHTRLNAQVKMLFSDYTGIADFDNPMTQEWLNKEERRDFTLIQIGKAYNYEYGSYKFNLEFEKAYIGADQAEVELLENSIIEFLDTPDDPLVTYKLPHTIRLSRSSSGWLIYDDRYEDVINLTIGDQNKAAILNNIRSNFDASPTDNKHFSPTPNQNELTYTYNSSNAVNYAMGWAISYNPAYAIMTGLGGDCANFVSQAIFAGTNGSMSPVPVPPSKLPEFDQRWYRYSAYNKYYGSGAWVRVGGKNGESGLMTFLINNTGFGPYGNYAGRCSAFSGDPVFFYDSRGWYHVVIVTDVIGDCTNLNNYYVNGHTPDQSRVRLSYYSAATMQFIDIVSYR
jgi:hypothetical protein